MRILLLGYGISNKSVYQYFHNENNIIDVICSDDKEKINYLKKNMPLYDYCFVSPGIQTSSYIYKLGASLSKIVTNEISYALSKLKDKIIIGVTGSDGKTTLVKLLEHILNNYNSTFVCGNIGITLLDKITKLKDKKIIIVELSSFQIAHFSSNIDLAVIKNLHPNHLDSYDDKYLYYADKLKLIHYASKVILGEIIKGKNIPNLLEYDFKISKKFIYENQQKIIAIDKLNRIDKSYLEDIIINLKVLKYLNYKYANIEPFINSFKGVKYRLEYLGKYLNTTFINDGKSSTSSSASYAFNNFQGRRILILGGIHKSKKFKIKFNENDEVYIYGINASLIKKELNKGHIFNTLKDILKVIKFDQKQTIIYSPGCSSFDQYNNYIERSKEFESWAKSWIK